MDGRHGAEAGSFLDLLYEDLPEEDDLDDLDWLLKDDDDLEDVLDGEELNASEPQWRVPVDQSDQGPGPATRSNANANVNAKASDPGSPSRRRLVPGEFTPAGDVIASRTRTRVTLADKDIEDLTQPLGAFRDFDEDGEEAVREFQTYTSFLSSLGTREDAGKGECLFGDNDDDDEDFRVRIRDRSFAASSALAQSHSEHGDDSDGGEAYGGTHRHVIATRSRSSRYAQPLHNPPEAEVENVPPVNGRRHRSRKNATKMPPTPALRKIRPVMTESVAVDFVHLFPPPPAGLVPVEPMVEPAHVNADVSTARDGPEGFTRDQLFALYGQIHAHVQLLLSAVSSPPSLHSSGGSGSPPLDQIVHSGSYGMLRYVVDLCRFKHHTFVTANNDDGTSERWEGWFDCDGEDDSTHFSPPLQAVASFAKEHVNHLQATHRHHQHPASQGNASAAMKQKSGMHGLVSILDNGLVRHLGLVVFSHREMRVKLSSSPGSLMEGLKPLLNDTFAKLTPPSDQQHESDIALLEKSDKLMKNRSQLFLPAEDVLLSLGIAKHGFQHDLIASEFLPTKSAKQIKIRMANLRHRCKGNPVADAVAQAKVKPLSDDEVEAIMQFARENGGCYKWKIIVKLLPWRDVTSLAALWEQHVQSLGAQQRDEGDADVACADADVDDDVSTEGGDGMDLDMPEPEAEPGRETTSPKGVWCQEHDRCILVAVQAFGDSREAFRSAFERMGGEEASPFSVDEIEARFQWMSRTFFSS